jgi:hypothetical protein
MVAWPLMVSWGMVFHDGRGAEGGGVRVGYTGSLACLVSRGGWWVRVGSTERGISSVAGEDGMSAGRRALSRWRWVRSVIRWA